MSNRRQFLQQTSAMLAAGVLRSKSFGQDDAAPQKRISVREFSANADLIRDLRKAVARMRSLPPRHPFSWTFQANIHWRPFFPDYVYQQADESDSQDLQVFRDNTGFSPEVNVFNTCPHGNWWFLPWHRAYLHYFERILQWASGNPQLMLPYWDYNDPQNRAIPIAFRQRQLTDGSPNPLYLPSTVTFRDVNDNPQIFSLRDQTLNLGLGELTSTVTNLNALNLTPFANTAPAAPGDAFGSPVACDVTCSCGSGSLERIPHNVVHVAIGGSAIVSGDAIRVGFMGDVSTAARDPLFWLHHCQIDRLWASWSALGDGRLNPTDPAWLDYEFTFYNVDTDGRPVPVTITPADVLDLTKLGYQYDRLEPLPAPPTPSPAPLMLTGTFREIATSTEQGNAGLTANGEDKAIALAITKPTSIHVKLTESVTDADARALIQSGTQEKGEVILLLEGLTLPHQPGVYFDVYLSPPDGANATPGSQWYVGSLTFFSELQHGNSHSRPLQPVPFRVPAELRDRIKDTLNSASVLLVPQTGVIRTNNNAPVEARIEHAVGIKLKSVRLLWVR